jgi:His/Glu/Gln/Arg/opine family amino acid ABC transporter permease subunit
MNWQPVLDSVPELLTATGLTCLLTVAIVGLSTIPAIPLGILRSRGGTASRLIGVFSWAMRATPALVILYIVFYGLPSAGFIMSALATAILGLGVQASAYNLEIVNGGIRSIDYRQRDSVRALGIGPIRGWFHILLPQALPSAIPPYISNAMVILKGTSLASVITVQELTGETNILINQFNEPIALLITSGLIYLVLATVLTILQAFLEARSRFAPGGRL